MQKKVSILFISIAFFAMLGGFWATSTAQKGPLKDISGTTYENAINYLLENGVVGGYDDGTYKPNKTINRAELLKIILESSNSDFTNASKSCFSDVFGDDWYVKYVCTAKDLGIVEGYSDGSFKPAQTVNFVEALKITLLGYKIDAPSDRTPWYKGYVYIASMYNLIPLEINAFGADLSRGQMADLITRLMKHKEGTQEDYLKSSFGPEYKNVNSYEIIRIRQANKTSEVPEEVIIRDFSRKADLNNILTAIETYQNDNMVYPRTPFCVNDDSTKTLYEYFHDDTPPQDPLDSNAEEVFDACRGYYYCPIIDDDSYKYLLLAKMEVNVNKNIDLGTTTPSSCDFVINKAKNTEVNEEDYVEGGTHYIIVK